MHTSRSIHKGVGWHDAPSLAFVKVENTQSKVGGHAEEDCKAQQEQNIPLDPGLG